VGVVFCRCCGRADLGAKLWPFGQACSLHSPRGRASYMEKAARFDYGAGFLPLLWEARPRGEALAFWAGLQPAFAAGARLPHWGKRLGLTTGLGFYRCCGRPDLGANGLRSGQACGLHSPRGAPPTLGKAARFDYGAGFLLLLWEARPRGEWLEVGAGLWPAFAAGARVPHGKAVCSRVGLGFCCCCGRPDLGANGF